MMTRQSLPTAAVPRSPLQPPTRLTPGFLALSTQWPRLGDLELMLTMTIIMINDHPIKWQHVQLNHDLYSIINIRDTCVRKNG